MEGFNKNTPSPNQTKALLKKKCLVCEKGEKSNLYDVLPHLRYFTLDMLFK